MDELKQKFPTGVDYVVPFDTTKFVQASIEEVVRTLGEAILLVAVVVFVFLQNWRATLIPLIAVPVSLIGTFAGLWMFGFSINTLTLFAMVLAIGIVVDDAIVVLENVERLMWEEKMQPREAAIEAMREVSGAVIAIVLVLCAVFVPVAFLGGIAGKLYQQFAVTVAIAVTLSGVVALTLTPALCALLLQTKHEEAPIFRPFNRLFDAFTGSYTSMVHKTLHHRIIGAVACTIIVGGSIFMFRAVPGGFVPAEDQGYLISALMLPDGASLQRTRVTGESFQQKLKQDDSVDKVFVIAGNDIIGGGLKPNAGTVFIPLKDWSERSTGADELAKKFTGLGMTLPDGLGLVFNPPAIRGLGAAGGFEAYIQARGDADPQKLAGVIQQFMEALKKRPELTGINTFFRPTSPQLYVEVDEAKAISMDIPVADVYQTLQATMGSLYVNDFNLNGRTYRVQLQADGAYRAKPDDLGKVYVRSTAGAMVPVGALIKVRQQVGAEQLERFNGFLAAKVLGNSIPKVSTGDAIKIVEEVARETLPAGYELAWTGQAFQEKRTGTTSAIAFVFGIIMVFLILAAQYEKWSLPLAVIMSVPFALFGALAAVMIRGMPNDIYFQIGLVVLIGLAAKNAILIVEFAAQKRAEGMHVLEAALEGARLRFRPIVMTSLAFILGVFPLVISTGAGAAARKSMGTGVFGGMLAATFIATIFIPMFFSWFAGRRAHQAPPPPQLRGEGMMRRPDAPPSPRGPRPRRADAGPAVRLRPRPRLRAPGRPGRPARGLQRRRPAGRRAHGGRQLVVAVRRRQLDGLVAQALATSPDARIAALRIERPTPCCARSTPPCCRRSTPTPAAAAAGSARPTPRRSRPPRRSPAAAPASPCPPPSSWTCGASCGAPRGRPRPGPGHPLRRRHGVAEPCRRGHPGLPQPARHRRPAAGRRRLPEQPEPQHPAHPHPLRGRHRLAARRAAGRRRAGHLHRRAVELDRARGLSENLLGLLVGQPGLKIAAGDLRTLPVPPAPPAGLPSALLEARPM
jgi:HAE1 family hydrophobic/amphiphilic exporter-1/multidrug efflux pump